MAIYLDSANLDEAHQARRFGWVRGVTTNPSLMARAGMSPETILAGLADLGFHQIYYQLVSQSAGDMRVEADKAHEIIKEALILKVAPTEAGYRFISEWGNEFPCCVTAVFSGAQALVAREAGARYIAVYVNRATKQMGDGPALVREVAQALAGSQTAIVAASLKSAPEALTAYLAGAHHITVPFDVLLTLYNHPLSLQTIDQFAAEGVGISLN